MLTLLCWGQSHIKVHRIFQPDRVILSSKKRGRIKHFRFSLNSEHQSTTPRRAHLLALTWLSQIEESVKTIRTNSTRRHNYLPWMPFQQSPNYWLRIFLLLAKRTKLLIRSQRTWRLSSEHRAAGGSSLIFEIDLNHKINVKSKQHKFKMHMGELVMLECVFVWSARLLPPMFRKEMHSFNSRHLRVSLFELDAMLLGQIST